MSHFEISWVRWKQDISTGEWVYDTDKRMTATLAQADNFIRTNLKNTEDTKFQSVFVEECPGPVPPGYLL